METNDTKVLSVRIPTELYNKLKKQSEKDIRSMSQQVVFYIIESLSEFKSSIEKEVITDKGESDAKRRSNVR